jgi:Tfp pilus assembly protein PilW
MKYQRGISLISLMVGLLVSLTATVGLLSVYRNSLQVTTTATQSATNDSQLAALLLRTGATVQDAGYGISSATFGTDIVAVSGATLNGTTLSGTTAATGTAVNAIVWDMLTGANLQCAGFLSVTANGVTTLTYLQSSTCANASAWGSTQWQSTTIASLGNTPISFTFAPTSCEPYGITATTGAYTVNLSTTNSIGTAVSSMQCLINFQ